MNMELKGELLDLFKEIEHGDQEHRDWLYVKMSEFQENNKRTTIIREDPTDFVTSIYFEEDDETIPATKNLLLFLNEAPFFINAQFLKGFGWLDLEYFEVPKENIIGWMDILDKINLQKTK